MRVDSVGSRGMIFFVWKHRDFLVCPSSKVSSATEPKYRLTFLNKDLQLYEGLVEFFRGNPRTISGYRVSKTQCLLFAGSKSMDCVTTHRIDVAD